MPLAFIYAKLAAHVLCLFLPSALFVVIISCDSSYIPGMEVTLSGRLKSIYSCHAKVGKSSLIRLFSTPFMLQLTCVA